MLDGPGTMRATMVQCNLASSWQQAGKMEDALAGFHASAVKLKEMLGPDHS